MNLVASLAQLVVDTLNGLSLPALIALSLAVAYPLVLWHELGHALAALALTRGSVGIGVGAAHDGPHRISVGRLRVAFGVVPFVGGECSYDPDTLRRARDEAWVAAAGPLASLAAAIGLAALALALGPADDLGVRVAVLGGQVAAFHALFTLLPIRYALGSGAAGRESDGLAVWRILTGSTGTIPALTHGVDSPTQRAAHPAVVILLVLIAGFTLVFVDFGLGLAVVGLFGLAWWTQTSDVRAGR